MIENLHEDERCIEGTVRSDIFDREMSVMICDGAPVEYAEKCARAMNSLSDETLDIICRAAKKYCLWMASFGSLDDEWYDMKVPIYEDTPAREILKNVCLDLVVEKPEDNSIGYCLSGSCGWEPEHGIEIEIKDNKVLYVGAYEGHSAWDDFPKDDEYNFVNLI
ncbi:MAG: hypothetical protein K2K57_02315 [Oscillospiraceae bacterium]|nr:hypothetical protein [Oscillospiraceae bacterium]